MADAFLRLSLKDRYDVLLIAAQASGRPAHLLEKDVWVVWALATLFASPHRDHLVFKGGTSLSKAYHAIDRFSEDVDLTYDIRAIAPDLVPDTAEPLPANPSQESRWTKIIRERLAALVAEDVAQIVQQSLAHDDLKAKLRTDGANLHIAYEPLVAGTGYVGAEVLLEFGARATGEPAISLPVTCDAGRYLPDLVFPSATPRVMRIERTFWEKATAAHVYCRSGKFRGGARYARHWYDLARLAQLGHAKVALADRAIARDVATHKSAFFVERGADGAAIDYHAAISGDLQLVPTGKALAALEQDYQAMVADGLVGPTPLPFADILALCGALELSVRAGR